MRVTEEEVVELVPLIQKQAAYLARRLPAGLTADDLESAGNEALVSAARSYDPDLGLTLKEYAARAIRNAMQAVVQKKQRENRKRRPFEIPLDATGEETALRPDPRVHEPADLLEAREAVFQPHGTVACRARGNNKVVLSRVEAESPSAARVGEMVARLREVMFGALREGDVAEVMRAVVRKAKKGNVGAAKLLFDQLSTGRSGVQVQQAVVINNHEGELS